MLEIWKDIPEYEGLYQVSNLGNVKSLNYNHTGLVKVLSKKRHMRKGKESYLTVTLCKNGSFENKQIHRLVASAFIENPENKLCVNHKDGNKENNAVSNLEWVTHKENTAHAVKTGLKLDSYNRGKTGSKNPLSKHVLQFSKTGELIKDWPCISEAARFYSCRPSSIINCCKGRLETVKGYCWKYTE